MSLFPEASGREQIGFVQVGDEGHRQAAEFDIIFDEQGGASRGDAERHDQRD